GAAVSHHPAERVAGIDEHLLRLAVGTDDDLLGQVAVGSVRLANMRQRREHSDFTVATVGLHRLSLRQGLRPPLPRSSPHRVSHFVVVAVGFARLSLCLSLRPPLPLSSPHMVSHVPNGPRRAGRRRRPAYTPPPVRPRRRLRLGRSSKIPVAPD